MLARLYLCWRWWRREDLPQLLTAATQLLRRDVTAAQAAAAAANAQAGAAEGRGAASSSGGSVMAGSATGNEQHELQQIYPWLTAACDRMRCSSNAGTASLAAKGAAGASDATSSSLPLPAVDVLSWTEQLPELAGFGRFLAAALGCYDDAKAQLDSLLLQHTLELLGPSTAAHGSHCECTRGQQQWPEALHTISS